MGSNSIRTFDQGDSRHFQVFCDVEADDYYAPYEPPTRRVPGDVLQRELLAKMGIDERLDKSDLSPSLDYELVAVIDSGIQVNHPLVRTRLVAWQDFTGEGIDDKNGHGTQRALITLQTYPAAQLSVAKVVGKSGGSSKHVGQAMEWAAQQRAGVVWMALGEYHPFCFRLCRLCRTATRLCDAGHVIISAPGNEAGKISCPAKAHGVISTVLSPDTPINKRLQKSLNRLNSIPNSFITC